MEIAATRELVKSRTVDAELLRQPLFAVDLWDRQFTRGHQPAQIWNGLQKSKSLTLPESLNQQQLVHPAWLLVPARLWQRMGWKTQIAVQVLKQLASLIARIHRIRHRGDPPAIPVPNSSPQILSITASGFVEPESRNLGARSADWQETGLEFEITLPCPTMLRIAASVRKDSG